MNINLEISNVKGAGMALWQAAGAFETLYKEGRARLTLEEVDRLENLGENVQRALDSLNCTVHNFRTIAMRDLKAEMAGLLTARAE